MSLTLDLPHSAFLTWLVYCRPTDQAMLDDDDALHDLVNGSIDQTLTGELHREWTLWRELLPMELCVMPRESFVTADPPLLPTGDFGVAEEDRMKSATHVAMVMAEDVLRPPRPGFWASLIGARAVARALDGVVVDPHRWVGHGLETLDMPAHPEGHLDFRSLFGVLASPSEQPDHLDLRTTALERWGLPNLVLPDVPNAAGMQACTALDGVAWALTERARKSAGKRVRWKDVTVYEGHVARAMGKHDWPVKSGARLRVGLTMTADHAGSQMIMLHNRRNPAGDRVGFATNLAMTLGGPAYEAAVA